MSIAPASTTTCPKCQMQVPEKAYVCAYCRNKLRTGPVALGCLISLGIVLLLGIFASLQTERKNSTGSQSTPATSPILSAEEIKKKAEQDRLEEERFLKSKAGLIWARHKDWDRETCKLIAQGKIQIGMATDQVRAAWGRPKSINSTVYSFGTHEQWVYGVGQYVYFENGVMTSLQQSK